jgi:hypothetical protein
VTYELTDSLRKMASAAGIEDPTEMEDEIRSLFEAITA